MSIRKSKLQFAVLFSCLLGVVPTAASVCEKADGDIEQLICADQALSTLDRKLAEVYAEAAKIATNKNGAMLKAEQRGWIKGRNDCWKSEKRHNCVEEAYKRRIAELQARYGLVGSIGPVRYICEDDSRNEVVVTFFKTAPPTLIAERGGQVSIMYIQPSGSGSRYEGRNESFWEHHGEATIVWGYNAPIMRCVKRP